MAVKVGVEFQPNSAMKSIYRIYFVLILLVGFISWMVPISVYVLLFESEYALISGLLFTPLLASSAFVVYWIQRFYESVTYLLTDSEIVVSQGVWFRSKSIVPYHRVTNVEIHQGPVSRYFRVGTVSIQTAGYSKSSSSIGRSAEAEILYIENFEDVKDTIRSFLVKTRPAAVEAGKETVSTRNIDSQILDELKKIRKALET